ncbi:hypothetical protein [Nostoc sp.]|uniref:hypothetical protein n=1 Tax=Nostoc sp. TaxID=1180 RepID=UPI002FF877A8
MSTMVTERLVAALVLSAAEVVEPCRTPTGILLARASRREVRTTPTLPILQHK